MRVVCAYCGRDLGTKPGGADDDVSHGICDDCVAEQNRLLDEYQARRKKEEAGRGK